MPNNTKNKMSITNWEGNGFIKEIKNKLFDADDNLDFNKLIPQPKEIFLGDLGEKEIKECEEKGIPTWSDWNRKNWNTKWGAYSCKIIRYDEEELIFTFETAWNTPTPIIEKIIELSKGSYIEFISVCQGGFFANGITVDDDGNRQNSDMKECVDFFNFALKD